MATGFGGLVDAVAFGALNEVLGEIRGKDGMSRPHRYEVTLFPPTGNAGSTGLGSNIFSKIVCLQELILHYNFALQLLYLQKTSR